MEIFDENVLRAGFEPTITSVTDAEAIHDAMVKLEFKASLGDWMAMPHYRGEQKLGWDLATNLSGPRPFRKTKQSHGCNEDRCWKI